MSVSESNILEIKEIFKLLDGKKNLIKLLKDIIKVADMVVEFKELYTDCSDSESSDSQDTLTDADHFIELIAPKV